MVWVKLDDGFPDHEKVVGLSDGAFRAYVTALCGSARVLTDGRIGKERIKVWIGAARRVDELLNAGLLERDEDGELRIHDYLRFNPSRAQVLAEREAAAERMRRSRSPERSGEQPTHVREKFNDPVPDPVPTPHPNPTDSKKDSRAKPMPIDADFIAELVAEYAGTFDEVRIRFELDKAENNKRVWDGWRDKRRGFRNWLKQAKEWQDERDRTTGRGATTTGGQSHGGSFGARGMAGIGQGHSTPGGAFPEAKRLPDEG